MLILVNLGRIDIGVNDLCINGKGGELAGDTVIEASTLSNK